MKAWLKVLAILFATPVFAVVFFQWAPELENRQVHKQFLKSIDKSAEFSETEKASQKKLLSTVNFVDLCKNPTAENQSLIANMQVQDVCANMSRFVWVQQFSLILIGLGILHLLLTWWFKQMASRSRNALIYFFRLGWRSSTAFSLISLLGQSIVGVFTFYYLTVLFTGRFYPQLLLMIVFGAAWALFKIAKVIITKVPIETHESATESITESQAPNLWKTVRQIATKLETSAPDHILVGLSTSFYVTEFPVRHTSGATIGRTLFLSAPMMQSMPLEEIKAIIGHEMGHFKGEDTALSRELTPLLMKSDTTMLHLAEAGFIGRPAMHAMGVFTYFFEQTIGAFRRDRELQADASGAFVTSAEAAALALTRYSYVVEAHQEALNAHLMGKGSVDQFFGQLKKMMAENDQFWTNVAGHQTPHPFDSHPPLAIRIEKLGFQMAQLRRQATMDVELTAYDALLGVGVQLKVAKEEQTQILAEAQERVQIRVATTETTEARKLLEKHFPTLVWQASRPMLYFGLVLLAAFTIGAPLAVIVLASDIVAKFLSVAVIGIGLFFLRDTWLDWKDQTLTLTSETIQLSSWKEPLKFKDIESMRMLSQNGNQQMHLTLTQKRGPLAKRPIARWKRKVLTINLSGMVGKPNVMAEKIIQYYTREIQK